MYEIIGKVIVFGMIFSVATVILYWLFQYLTVAITRIIVHAYYGAGINEQFKQQKWWRLKTIWGILYTERKTNWNLISSDYIRSEDYEINFQNKIFPKIHLYKSED